MEFDNNEQPLIVGGLNYEESTFDNMKFVVEEYAEGIISFQSKKNAENFLEDIKCYITEDIFNTYMKIKKPFFYGILQTDKYEIYLYAEDFVREMYEYKDYEDKLLSSLKNDID
ncbi:hypothetical protein [Oceanirhabdus sp. W0125-5]|uniref:hypothetical protein n=1 Tax=Oceanirhabdus sp. W0125-5 TaxID=2999116 RepID=UPI0022F2B41D|nr:hypothetical protein [Oceanirhabdus sp. W0125-5]WBW99656.1 hypothetical protein OW730_13170 [Oceanirhabdus sp. W0125-5]